MKTMKSTKMHDASGHTAGHQYLKIYKTEKMQISPCILIKALNLECNAVSEGLSTYGWS